MGYPKKTKIVPALRISEEMHRLIKSKAQRSNRKFQDEVRHLIGIGLQSSEQVKNSSALSEKNIERLLKRRIMDLQKSMESVLLALTRQNGGDR